MPWTLCAKRCPLPMECEMKIEARWLEGGGVEVLGDFTVLATVKFTTEGRQYQKKQKLELVAAAIFDLASKKSDEEVTHGV